ncbi:hypothetical protein VNO78_13181 [Psophocarpus tetragonolobus]|uniref:C3H1-type domain-containing protein n=1 Tax=Psophocarpus tetragonolobus TaxID=3891 RepID=A0AAN9SQV1_PSOTE
MEVIARKMEEIGWDGRGSACEWTYPCMFLRRKVSLAIIDLAIQETALQTCKYWINGNCMYGQRCQNLHAWSDKEGIDTKNIKEDNRQPKRLVWWTTPPITFVKINCDGAFTSHGNKVAARGVVKDWKTNFLLGFSTSHYFQS